MSIDLRCLDKRLLYVTGKGGVGRTTVVAALALAAARRGRRTLICEVSDADHVRAALAGAPADDAPYASDGLPDGVTATSIDISDALEDWLGRQLGSATLVRTLSRSQAFQYFVAAAPGARELITIGKVYDLVEGDGRHDLVIVDAAASGHGVAMLETPATFGQIARVGTVRRQAEKIRALLTDRERTGYVAVTLPEETPVNETLEVEQAIARAVGALLDAVVVNAVRSEPFDDAEAARVRGALAGNPAGPQQAALAAALRAHERARHQRAEIERLRAASAAPLVTLPFVEDAGSAEAPRRLSAALTGVS